MSKDTPVSSELQMMLPAIADTMKYAIQALAECAALSEILISKGIATKQEIDVAMRSTAALKQKLIKALDEQIDKQS